MYYVNFLKRLIILIKINNLSQFCMEHPVEQCVPIRREKKHNNPLCVAEICTTAVRSRVVFRWAGARLGGTTAEVRRGGRVEDDEARSPSFCPADDAREASYPGQPRTSIYKIITAP